MLYSARHGGERDETRCGTRYEDITSADWVIVEESVRVLDCIGNATDILQADGVTVSAILPLIDTLIPQLRTGCFFPGKSLSV